MAAKACVVIVPKRTVYFQIRKDERLPLRGSIMSYYLAGKHYVVRPYWFEFMRYLQLCPGVQVIMIIEEENWRKDMCVAKTILQAEGALYCNWTRNARVNEAQWKRVGMKPSDFSSFFLIDHHADNHMLDGLASHRPHITEYGAPALHDPALQLEQVLNSIVDMLPGALRPDSTARLLSTVPMSSIVEYARKRELMNVPDAEDESKEQRTTMTPAEEIAFFKAMVKHLYNYS
jgi:hypothetical protein